MELRHLRYFRAVAEDGHMTRAAERLGIAQPALSQQIRNLEEELGVPLFDRVGRGLALNEAGRLFLEEVRDVLVRVDGAASLARQAGRGEVGRLRVGFTASTCFNPAVTEALKAYRQTWPGVELILEEGRSSLLEAALEQGTLDAAFLRPPLRSTERLGFELVATEPMVAALPVGHRHQGRSALKLEELRDEPFILYPRANGPGLSENVVAACQRAGFTPKVAQQTPQLASTVNLVAAAIGIAIVPDCMRQLRPDSVRYVTLQDAALKAEFGLAWRRDDRSRTVRHLIDTATQADPRG
ncbi:LysR family transcriptional regulator [Roseomonas elaeocarpi]|uniref:LysR family transcriptional regulator n=1 Tax=Roseomonas elaeocarpi TaxID=907779 RepID=A0ABV6JMY8_9PROT